MDQFRPIIRDMKIALQGLGDHGAAHLQHVRPAGRVGQDVDDARRIQLQRLHQRQRLAQRLPVHHQRQVHGQLHGRARAVRADVLDAAAQLREHFARTLDVLGLAAGEPDQLALLGRADAAAHRAFDIRRARGCRARGQLLLLGRGHGAHLDEQPAGAGRGQQAARRQVHLVERLLVGEEGDDGSGGGGQLAWRRGPGDAGVQQRLRASLAAVPHADFVSQRLQARGHRAAHLSRSRDPDLHAISL
jgi:hypothetical protein